MQFVLQAHDCWVVQLGGAGDGERYEFYMGGTEESDRDQGLLLFERKGARGGVGHPTPARAGTVTVYFARWGFACFTTAKGGRGEFDADTMSFETSSGRIAADCPPPPSPAAAPVPKPAS